LNTASNKGAKQCDFKFHFSSRFWQYKDWHYQMLIFIADLCQPRPLRLKNSEIHSISLTTPPSPSSIQPQADWPSLVDDINRQSAGTHILLIGYSVGANNAVLVANNTTYIDSIIALQPSMFNSNTSLTGKVGRIVEIYNPNPWMTLGGMGSQKLVGPNIEYITNNDTHPGAPFNSEFRALVKSEIVRLSAEPAPNPAQAEMPNASHPTSPGATPAGVIGSKADAALQRRHGSS
jgi:hypothetical protein